MQTEYQSDERRAQKSLMTVRSGVFLIVGSVLVGRMGPTPVAVSYIKISMTYEMSLKVFI